VGATKHAIPDGFDEIRAAFGRASTLPLT